MKDTAETIEFFTPKLGLDIQPYIEAGQKQGIHHLARYHWACLALDKARPRTILDIACGAGYGSFILAQAFPDAEVIGADYDERAVDYAKSHFAAQNLSYAQGDIVRWLNGEAPLGAYDAITSFDTLEHLLHREIALQNLADNLSRFGVLLLSTPCGHSESRLNPGWEHHKLEYSYRDLYAFLKRYFAIVSYPGEAEFIGLQFWKDVVNRDTVRYLNRMNPVICSGPLRSSKLPVPVL
jgi:SAM-dependent methyltransferase